jgi:hypothetical protein
MLVEVLVARTRSRRELVPVGHAAAWSGPVRLHRLVFGATPGSRTAEGGWPAQGGSTHGWWRGLHSGTGSRRRSLETGSHRRLAQQWWQSERAGGEMRLEMVMEGGQDIFLRCTSKWATDAGPRCWAWVGRRPAWRRIDMGPWAVRTTLGSAQNGGFGQLLSGRQLYRGRLWRASTVGTLGGRRRRDARSQVCAALGNWPGGSFGRAGQANSAHAGQLFTWAGPVYFFPNFPIAFPICIKSTESKYTTQNLPGVQNPPNLTCWYKFKWHSFIFGPTSKSL